ncbi:TonB-dependent receptor [Pontibacter sp. E15-1]|uniref:TonB-dependent receptor plug domain-containing protein n=1 Tax=Pontibacter sp. E15-1 TaxID=2919918 RepID=UPI001F4F9D03|nr:TonB-dependent receptor [Pontibacter sp. E15-1]MCJ8165659.1 TonB-dependent receptor [Pontibacter sp. E15-1]
MKIFLYIGVLLLLATASRAQTVTIKDQVTHLPLEAVLVYSNSEEAILTNGQGQADISALRGAARITVRSIGYKSVSLSFAELENIKFQVLLPEDNVSLNAVVISASRWKQEKREVPGKVSTISPAEVLLQNPQTAADMLGASGEVYIQKSQLGGGSPMIRGFATNRVLLAVDGVRMNTAIFRSGNLQNVISLDPFALDRTEVLFGPGSVSYGSDAIGGVMSFYTLSPQRATTGEAIVKGSAVSRWSSANNEKTGHVDFSVGLRKWAFLTSATYSDFNDLTMGANGPEEYLRPEYARTVNGTDEVLDNPDPREQVYSGYSQLNLMQKVRFSPTEHWDINYGFHYSTTSDYPRYDRLIRYRKGTLRSAEWYYGPQEWMMNHLKIGHEAGSKLYDKLSINLAHQFFEESRHDRDLGKTTRYNRTEKVHAWSANLDFEKQLSERHVLLYGAEAVYNTVSSTGTDENVLSGQKVPGPARYPDGSDWSSYAAFATYQFKATEKLSLQTGARYNHFILHAAFDNTFYPFPFSKAEINAGALTGSAGLVYYPAPSWQLSTNMSTGFRSPNIDDIGKVFDSAPGSVLVPNPDLKSEYAYNVDFGMAKTFGSFLKVDASAFYTYLNNALVRRNFLLNGQDSITYEGERSQVQALQNAANAKVWGVQARVELTSHCGLGLSSRFNYQKGEEELENGSTAPLRHAAPWFGATHLTYSINRFKADAYALFNGEITNANLAPEEQDKDYMYAIDENGQPYSPSWVTLNFKALYKISDHLLASAGLENITNQRYKPYSSGIVAPGRNFILSLRASF